VDNSEHFMFSGDLAELAITIAKAYRNVICLLLDVTLVVQNLVSVCWSYENIYRGLLLLS